MKIQRLIEALPGASLCYGEPVQVGASKVIPVARVQAMGGGGFGRDKKDSGGGGGGMLDARPMGFIHVTADGARYERIPDPEQTRKTLTSLAKAATALVGIALGARQVRTRRPLLGR